MKPSRSTAAPIRVVRRVCPPPWRGPGGGTLYGRAARGLVRAVVALAAAAAAGPARLHYLHYMSLHSVGQNALCNSRTVSIC